MIHITKRGWEHTLKYHSRKHSTKHPKKSTFNDDEDLIQLLNEAALHEPAGEIKRNLVRTFDAGHEVGIDYRDGQPTSTVTVLTRLNGDLVTMFPGLP
jgi:hypothetical protein